MTKARGVEYAELGRAVRVMRAEVGVTQEGLGLDSGLHRNYVGAIERGEINPTFRVLRDLAEGLRVPLSEVLARAESLHARDGSQPR